MDRIIACVLLSLGGAALLTLAVFFARHGISERARRILLGLVAEAEAYFGAGTGAIKFSAVLGRLYAAMPRVMQILFRYETVEGWIEDAVTGLKTYLSEGRNESA